MLRIVKYEEGHLEALRVDGDTKEAISFVGLSALGKSLASGGPAYSAFFDDDLLVIAGVNIFWAGAGEAWAFMGRKARDHGFLVHRNTMRVLEQIAFEYKLERIQAVVKKGFWPGIRWLSMMRFRYEGEMIAYFNSEDYLRYARIFH